MELQAMDVPFDYALDMEPEGYEITNDVQAEMALRDVLEQNATRDRLLKAADEMISKYQAQKRALVEEFERKNAWNTMALQNYFAKVDKHTTKTQQSYRLLSGRLLMKRQHPEYEWNEADLLGWAQDNAPEYIKEVTKTSIDWAGLKKAITQNGDQAIYTETGEVLPVTVRARPDVFVIEGGKD